MSTRKGRAMDLDGLAWRTGSCTGDHGGSRVEVAAFVAGGREGVSGS